MNQSIFKEDINLFFNPYTLLCISVCGVAIFASQKLRGRIVTWIQQTLGIANKIEEIAKDSFERNLQNSFFKPTNETKISENTLQPAANSISSEITDSVNTEVFDLNTNLIEAATKGDLDAVKQLVITPGIDLDFRDHRYGSTALMFAAEEGHLEVVTFLATLPGVNLSAKNNRGNTALMFAAIRFLKYNEKLEYFHMFEFLATLPGVDLTIKNINGDSVLTLLKRNKENKNINFFLKKYSELFSPKEIAYAKWYFGWKEISHILGLSGQMQIDNTKKIDLEGSRLEFYFGKKITKSLNKLAEIPLEFTSSQILKETANAMQSLTNSPEKCFERWQSGKLVILPTNNEGHYSCILILKNTFILCDEGGDFQPYMVYTFDRNLLTLPIIKKILSRDRKENNRDLLEHIISELQCLHGPREKQLESMYQPLQTIGNCSWKSLEAAVQAALTFLALDSESRYPLTESEIEVVMDQQHKLFTQWKEEHQKWRIEKHHSRLKKLKDIFDPDWKISEITLERICSRWEEYGLEQIAIPYIPLWKKYDTKQEPWWRRAIVLPLLNFSRK